MGMRNILPSIIHLSMSKSDDLLKCLIKINVLPLYSCLKPKFAYELHPCLHCTLYIAHCTLFFGFAFITAKEQSDGQTNQAYNRRNRDIHRRKGEVVNFLRLTLCLEFHENSQR